MAKLLRLPTTRRLGASLSTPLRNLPRHSVDDWGRDPRFVEQASRLARLRWDVAVDGEQHLPRRGGALLVASSRRYSLSALFATLAIGEIIDRPVRFVGRPDSAPVGDVLRRIGGLLARRDEIAGALRHHEIVLMTAAPTGHAREAGAVDHALVAAAVATGVPVYPVATLSSRSSRAARVKIGPQVRPAHDRRGPLAEVELADATQRSLQRLLDALGLLRTGNPVIDLLARN